MKSTFSWGMTRDILFPGWPGEGSLMSYILTLIVVFAVCVIIEWLSHVRLMNISGEIVAAGLLRTAMYSGRVALAYLVMLAVMSFDVGVLVAAVSGYALGFLVFGTRVFIRNDKIDQLPPDLPPLTC